MDSAWLHLVIKTGHKLTFETIKHNSLTSLKMSAGMVNKILRLEQEGEHIHAVINRLERNLTMTTNKSTRYWQVLREYENKIYNGVK